MYVYLIGRALTITATAGTCQRLKAGQSFMKSMTMAVLLYYVSVMDGYMGSMGPHSGGITFTSCTTIVGAYSIAHFAC